MASLDPALKKAWKAALTTTKAPWIVCGIQSDQSSKPAKLEGVPGLIDWLVHGQVSKRLLKGQLEPGECCIVPGDPRKNRPSFLLFPLGVPSATQLFLEKARKLQIQELAFAEATFPEDFLNKVKQTLKKEGIRCLKLEPET